MLSEQTQAHVGWFVGCLSFVWLFLSRRLVAWIGAAVVAGYCARWGAAFSAGRRAANLITDLTKRAVFITGCDSGFGQKLALRLHSMGVIVYAGVLSDDGEGAKTLRAQGCKVIKVDVTKDAFVLKAVEYIKEDLGSNKLHAIVNNAGVCDFGHVEWCSVDLYNRLLQVNTLGTIRVTQAFLPLLRTKRGSRVVIVASVAGRYTLPGFTAYSVSKHAVLSFADGLRKEMRPWKVSVHMIQPTAYSTTMATSEFFTSSLEHNWQSTNPEVKKEYGENYFQTFKANYLRGMRKLVRKNTSEVVDDMVDALLSKEPQINYLPSFSTKFVMHVMTSVPTWLQDWLLSRKIIPDVPPPGAPEAEISTGGSPEEDETEIFL